MHTDKIFVYGTLKPVFDNEMSRFLVKNARWLDSGELTGSLYLIEREIDGHQWSYPAFVETGGGKVFGEIFQCMDIVSVLKVLDEYEGYGPPNKPPFEYNREWRLIKTNDGVEHNAWVYIYNWSTVGSQRIHSGVF